ncbi:MAG: DinB family protein, partial [Chloroflexi bacterium]|nr:DinB family protein [Chloroflexota bacterium]
MNDAALGEARNLLVAAIRKIPDEALDYRPAPSEWSVREIVAHVANANDFYTMIIHAARRSAFESVTLVRDSADYRMVAATNDSVMRCATTSAALAAFEAAFDRMIAAMGDVRPDEWDREFSLVYSWRPSDLPEVTNLKKRVI